LGVFQETNAQNQITFNAELGRDTISRHIYGHFAEHLGKCIYGGFYVGAGNKDIPNKDGVRTYSIEALTALKLSNLP